MHQVGGGTQYVVWATRHAELAGCAMLLHVVRRDRTGRSDRRLAFRCHFIFNDGQATVYFHLGLGQCCSRSSHGSGGEEGTTPCVDGFGFRLGFLGGVMQRIEFALVKAVAADHAT